MWSSRVTHFKVLTPHSCLTLSASWQDEDVLKAFRSLLNGVYLGIRGAICSYHRGLFSPLGSNHNNISASTSPSLARVYLQCRLSSFNCLLTLVILLYLLMKHSGASLHACLTRFIPIVFFISCFLFSLSLFHTTFSHYSVTKECTPLRGMFSVVIKILECWFLKYRKQPWYIINCPGKAQSCLTLLRVHKHSPRKVVFSSVAVTTDRW